jgi:HlyD family secretion protein
MAAKKSVVFVVVAAAAAGLVYENLRPPSDLVLTGIVTTDDVVVSPQVGGQVTKLLVREGDRVARNQLLATLDAGELRADREFFAHSEEGSANRMEESEAALRFEELQTAQRIREAEASLAAAVAQRDEAVANLAHAKLTLERGETVLKSGGVSQQEVDEARSNTSVASSRLAAIEKRIEAERATLALARSAAQEIAQKRSALSVADRQHAAAAAQTEKANVRLAYSELHAPVDGIVDVRAVRAGEVVTPGQPVLTLIDPDDLWVRADVEETYVDRVRLGDTLQVRLPSGELRKGTVFYRGVDAGFATQRDVSRTKRDIKTFEVRLRVPNSDRKLAVGMTAYVMLHVAPAAS